MGLVHIRTSPFLFMLRLDDWVYLIIVNHIIPMTKAPRLRECKLTTGRIKTCYAKKSDSTNPSLR